MDIESRIQKNVPLSGLCTYKIGGQAEYFLEITNQSDLQAAVIWAAKKKKNIRILGGGSNVLINDEGVVGLVVKMSNKGIKVMGERIECGAGAELARVVITATSNGLSGLEWAAGIPGATIGGSVRGNAGAFGRSISDNVETVLVYDKKNNRFDTLSKNLCKFGYRDSILKKKTDLVIWSVVLKMETSEPAIISNQVSEYIKYRNQRQPKLPSAGSVFKNIQFSDLEKASGYISALAMKEDVVKGGKVGAGWLIDKMGFKGEKVGGAKISLEHANFIVNTDKASATDVIKLIETIKSAARTRFGVGLEEEIQYFGF